MDVLDSRISVLPSLEFESIPEGTPKKIKASPNKLFYMDAIRSGWSIRQLEACALERFGEKISRDTFHRFREVVPPKVCLPETFRKKFLNDIDARIECLPELQNAIELQKQRLTNSVTAERLMSTKTGGLSAVSPETRAELALYWQMLKEYTSLCTNLGIVGGYRKDDIPAESGISLEQIKMIEFAEGLPKDRRDQMKEICQEIIKNGGNGKLHEEETTEDEVNKDDIIVAEITEIEVKDA